MTTTTKRTFVPQQLDCADFANIRPLYESLLNRSIASPQELEKWLLDFSELFSVVDEYGARRFIEMTCHTDDKSVEAAYLNFVENVEPHLKPMFFAMQKKYLESPHRSSLADRKYQILTKHWQADVEVFRDENVPLETEVTKAVNEFDKINGAMMVEFRGQQYTQQQMARFLEEPDRATREQAWVAANSRRLQDRDKLDELYDRVIELRTRIAKNAGKSDFRALIWKSLKRFDYTPDDCLRFSDAIEKHIVPLARELDRRRAAELKVERLRPWDLNVDPQSRAPLRPFDQKDIDGFVKKTGEIFHRLSPELAVDFDQLRKHNNLDLNSRKGKAPGGYQSTLNESRQPFIFMNAAGLQRDVDTLLHEGGHAFHAQWSSHEPLVFLRSAPMEFCEVASMSMELFGADHLDVFYSKSDHDRAKRVHLEGIIKFFPWMATIDSFQHWIYTNPRHSREQRTSKWTELMKRFMHDVDWSGHEAVRDSYWQRQMHLFHVPFYYVEYGIAQLGALQMWLKSLEDTQRALSNYRSGLKLGGTRPLPDLFQAAGIHFDFTEKTIQPLMSAIREELGKLPA